MGFNSCIKCYQGGKLLVCNEDACPTIIHEKCLGCPARSDHMGRFCCPYCLCRKANAALNQASQDALMLKKALSSFIDAKMIDSNDRIQDNPTETETEAFKSVGENNCDKTAKPNENNSIPDILLGATGGGDETSNKLSNQHEHVSRKRAKCDSPCELPSSDVDRSGRSSPVIPKSPRKTDKAISPSKPLPSNIHCPGNSSAAMRKSPRKAPVKVSQKISFPTGRRRRLLWTEEEEEMLKKGVAEYASEDDKSMPWRQILEFGRDTFHRSRMPGDLKDKWRNMLAKEKLAK
ncbi:hypothetical protein LIER_42477 [Lithospermum erythrorhizon]|uniref:Myb-like domain-containing protein n=1 Tax=Lithospermum erythrorhizon TaxID=34254 RepID=A0AAV3RU77_LITER